MPEAQSLLLTMFHISLSINHLLQRFDPLQGADL